MANGTFFDYGIHPEIGDAGTYFYHSHVGFQQTTAHGALIEEEAKPPQTYDDDRTLVLADYYNKNDTTIVDGLLANPFKWSGEPNNVAINGHSGNISFNNASNPSCTPHIIHVEPGKRYRLRFVGATALFFVRLASEQHHSLEVIEADGLATKPVTIDYIEVVPGQRFSHVLQSKSLANYKLQTRLTFGFDTRLEIVQRMS